MKDQILQLIDEQSSPLFRIMSVQNDSEPTRRGFYNNVCATHIGHGYVLSVAHNLRTEAQVIKSIDEAAFQMRIIANCNPTELQLFLKCYQLDPVTNIRYITPTNEDEGKLLIAAFQRIDFDTRWVTQYENGLCKPFLIIQFKNNEFFSDAAATANLDPNYYFPEPGLNSHTFLIELELIDTFYAEDFALYRIVAGIDNAIIEKIPSLGISPGIVETGKSLYCLQGSPSGTNLGRMVNECRIEGILDHHAIEPARFDGPIFRDGLRYLLKGYFRFGSSGAPYLKFNDETGVFELNAIQSEASPIQLLIKGSMEGNSQYINAIASPVELIRDELNNKLTAKN